MPQLLWRITATDGTFETGQTNLFDFTTTDLTAKEKQVTQFLLPNITQLSKYAAITSDVSSSAGTRPYFLANDGTTWMQEDAYNFFLVDSTADCYMVIIPNSSSITRVYLCKTAAERELIPDYATKPTIEYRIVSPITPSNYDSWRKWSSTKAGNSETGIILAPVRMPVNNDYGVFLKAKPSTDKTKIRLNTVNFWYNEASSDVDQGALPVVSQFLRKDNQIIYNLDERVTILETQVANLQAVVTNLEERLTSAFSATSKFFVSR